MKARREFVVCVNMHTHRHMERSSGPSSGGGDQGREGSCSGAHSSGVCLLLSSLSPSWEGGESPVLSCSGLGVHSQAAEPLGRVVSFWAGTFFFVGGEVFLTPSSL